MQLQLLTSLLILWGVLAVVLVLLMIYRGVVAMHEDEGLYLSEGERSFAQETEDSIQRQEKLGPWIRYAGVTTGLVSVLIAGVWLYQNWNLFA